MTFPAVSAVTSSRSSSQEPHPRTPSASPSAAQEALIARGPYSFSGGVARASANLGSIYDLYRSADIAAYRAKAAGGARTLLGVESRTPGLVGRVRQAFAAAAAIGADASRAATVSPRTSSIASIAAERPPARKAV